MHDPAAPVIPPPDFIARVNAGRPGLKPLIALDPLAMLLWAQVTDLPPQPLAVVTSCT